MLPQQNILRLPVAPLKTLCDDTNKKALPAALRIHSIISSVLFESAGQETKMEHEPTRTSPQTMQGKGDTRSNLPTVQEDGKSKRHLQMSENPTVMGGGKRMFAFVHRLYNIRCQKGLL